MSDYTKAASSITFNFTGLGMLSYSKSAASPGVVRLVDASSTLGIPHECLLVVDLESFVFPEDYGTPHGGPATPMSSAHIDPQIVRVGPNNFGVWGLAGCELSVAGVHVPDFKFPATGREASQPHPADLDWSGVEWFADAADVAAAAHVDVTDILIDETKVTARVTLEHGLARGMTPFTACERGRTCEIVGLGTRARSYAAEIAVDYPVSSETLDLRIVTEENKPNGAIIRLRRGAAISVMNSPLSTSVHDHMRSHFTAYSMLLGIKSTVDIQCSDPCHKLERHRMTVAKTASGGQPIEKHNPPDAGCLMMVFGQ